MKKFIVPIINLVSLILASVVFGLGATTAVKFGDDEKLFGNWYELVWTRFSPLSVIAVVGFFLFCVACFLTLLSMIPFKFRFAGLCLAGLMFIGAGVMFLLTPNAVYTTHTASISKTDSFIAMIVLVFVAGGLELVATAVSLLPEKK